MELVSIIIPVYNCEKYIKRCLDSIINQTYKNIEIIIINDGSTDKTLEIINTIYNDSRIKIIDKENEGVSIARNIGIESSKGKYITFIDADDWLELDAIETLYNIIEEKKVDVVRANCFLNKNEKDNLETGKLYNLKDKVFLKENNEIESYVIDHFLMVEESIPNLVMLLFMNKNIFEKVKKFNSKLYMMEDVAFYLSMYCNIDSVYFTSYTSYHYFFNNDSVTKSKDKYLRTILGIVDANKEIKKILIEEKIDNENRIKKLNANHLKMITNYILYAYRDNVKDKKHIVNKVFELEKKEKMTERCNLENIPLKNKILIILLKLKMKLFFVIALNAFNIILKLLKK